MSDITKKIDSFYKELSTAEFESITDKSQQFAAFIQWIFENKLILNKHPEFLAFLAENAKEVTADFVMHHREKDGFLLNYQIGKSAYHAQDMKNTIKFNKIAVDIYQSLNKTTQKNLMKKATYAYYYSGVSAFSLSRYDEASRNYYNGLQLMEEFGDDANACMCYNGLGFIYRNMKDYPKAMENFQKATETAECSGKQDIKAIALNEIGNIYMVQGDFKKSMEYHQMALEATKDETAGISSSFIYHDIAIMFTGMERFEDALKYFQKHYEMTVDKLTIREKAICKLNLGTVYLHLKRYEDAEKILWESLEYARQAESIYEQGLAYEELSSINAALGRHDKAYEYLHEAYKLSKDVFSKDRMDLIQELQVKYESEAREREAEIYRLKNVELVEANQKLKESYDELEKAQQEIIQLEKQKSVWAMAVTANHEINQPLMVIRGNMDLLRMKIDRSQLSDKHVQYLDNIEKSILRIGEILRTFKEQCPIRFTEYSSVTEMVVFDKDEEHDGE